MHRFLPAFIFFLLYTCALQATEVLERHIDVRFQQMPLKDALAVVGQKAGFEWSYNANIIDATKKVTLIANDWTVRETLFELLGDGYDFKTNGNYLILKKRKKTTDQLSGYIKDKNTGQRVANATIYDRRTLRSTTTDSNGYYQLRVKRSTEIAIARLDYRDTIFPVTANSARFQKFDLQVTLPDKTRPLTLQENVQRVATQAERLFQVSLNKWAALNVPDSLRRRFQLSLLPKIGTNHVLSGKVVNDWSINLLAGTSLGNRRAELAGIANFTRKNMTGVQVAGVFNELHGNASGVQLAGIYNHVGDTLRGIQAAGIVNVAKHSIGFSIQWSGVANSAGQIDGIQAAGIYNFTTQIRGCQLSGLANKADTIQGVQATTIYNRARKMRGLQIGLINSAQNLHGLQIGLINRSGRRVLPLINW